MSKCRNGRKESQKGLACAKAQTHNFMVCLSGNVSFQVWTKQKDDDLGKGLVLLGRVI